MMKMLEAGEARIPALGVGTWQLTGAQCRDAVADALAIGYRHVDTAEMYENHEAVGAALRDSAVDREDVFLTTKIWHEHLARDAVREATEQSLRDLGVDYVDLLLIHWPNESVPLQETLEAMIEQRAKGRVRHLGVSNFPPSWVENAADLAPVVCDQVEYHPLLSQGHLLEPLRARDMALVAYSPLAHGKVVEQRMLQEVGEAHGCSAARVALAWLLHQPLVGAIPKASSREHLEDNFAAQSLELAALETEQLDTLAHEEGARTVDPDFAPTWER